MAVPFVLRGAVPVRHGLRQPEIAAGSLVTLAHLFFIIALYRIPGPSVSAEPVPERVTYVDVPPPTQQSARAMIAKPKPIVVSSEVTIPAATPAVEHPDRMAGFQVLLTPRETAGLPAEVTTDSAVSARDFSGRGVVGGVAGGKPPATAPPAVAESIATAGGTDVDAPTRNLARRMVGARMVRPPRLLNRDEVLNFMQASYPTLLRQAGIEGTAIVEVMVDTNGVVVPGYTRVLQSTHPLFTTAALAVALRARFEPGEGDFDGERVSLSARVRLPMRWTQDR